VVAPLIEWVHVLLPVLFRDGVKLRTIGSAGIYDSAHLIFHGPSVHRKISVRLLFELYIFLQARPVHFSFLFHTDHHRCSAGKTDGNHLLPCRFTFLTSEIFRR